LELPYWEDLDVCHSIHVVDVKKNVCESLLAILLNSDGKTRDHEHARAELRKMGIKLEGWLDDSLNGTELPTSCITLSKNVKEFCGFVGVSYAALQAHGIINVALHREYPPGIIFI
jgi:hypothetical protein